MRTSSCALGVVLAFAAGCGGTVVFEEDGGGGDGGGGLSGPTTSSGPTQPSTGPGGGDGGAGDGGAGPTTTVATTVTVGPTTTVSVVSSVSTGPGGCGSLDDELQLPPQCDGCLEARCCDQLLACDEGTACWDCIFFGERCNEGQPSIDALVFCIQDECDQQCNGGGCGPDEFECPEGGCIPERWVCDGFPDCPKGGDEFCGCGPGDFQCFESGECIPGEWQCDGFVDCEDGTDEQFCGCGPGDFQCFESGECIPGEWQCNGSFDCADGTDELDCPDTGICQSGLTTGDPQFDLCLENACCDAFNFCTDFGSDVDPCIDCFNQGGGPRCDEAITCADANCSDSFLITPPGEAYGHHGECSGWNACGDAATCAQWACQAEGFGTLVSFGEERPCTQWDNCRLFFDGCCAGVDYEWGNWCEVMGVGEIRCAP